MHRYNASARGASRPPSAPPPSHAGVKRKEREYEQEAGDETNINVVVRCRGRNEREVRENSGVVVSTNGVKANTVELSMGPNALSNKTYHFDKVFSPAADQAIVYEDVVAPILSEMLGGYNCTIFAYGQTGTGKTYTMSGDMTESCGLLTDAAGIIPRVLQSIFQKLEADGLESTVKCSFIELYNEELRDLLAQDESVKLKIYDDSNKKNQGATIVQGMEESHITDAASGIKLLQQGSLRRQVAATKCNDLSSRSHTVFTITTYVKKQSENVEDYICSGKLNLVDLAGSENIQRSGAENKRAAEAGLINKSLLTLGRVINALVDKSQHIPYRESKLTRLLQDSLGGRTKTCIIATVSPARSNLEETISTLDYAFRAKNIRNKPQINSMISKKTLLKEFTTEIEKLKSELIATRQRNGVYMSNEQFEQMTIESESRRILSEEQKARIETMEVSLRNKVQELFSLTNNFTSLKKDNDVNKTTLHSTKDVLQKTELVLANTKATLEEETALRQKYAETEDQLHDVGNELITAVGETLRDVDGLHKKLKRRSVLHGQNKDAWESIQAQGLAVLNAVDINLQDLRQRHHTTMSTTAERIQSFITHELGRTREAQSYLDQGVNAVDTSIREVETQSSNAQDDMNEVLEEIKVLRDDVRAKVGEGLQGLSEAAARISGEVISELDSFHTQLHSSYSGLGKEFKNIFEDLARQLVSQREESDRLRNALREANKKNIQSSLTAASELESVLAAEREYAEEEREAFLQQISSLVARQSSAREHRFNTLINQTSSSIISATEEFELADKKYINGMQSWAERDTCFLEKIVASKEDIKQTMKRDWAAVHERNTAIQMSTKTINNETVKIVDSQIAAMASQMAALDEFVMRARQQNSTHHKSHLSSLETMSSQIKHTFARLSPYITSDVLNTFNDTIQERLNHVLSTFSSIEPQILQPLHSLQDDLVDTTMTDYVPTGTTPSRQEYLYPITLPRTIPLPESISTTPKNPPLAGSFAARGGRTPGNRSPRKVTSPQKSPRKQTVVRADTPPVVRSAATVEHVTDPIRQRANSKDSLKEIDVNTINTPAAVSAATTALSSQQSEQVNSSSFTSATSTNAIPANLTTSSRLPTKTLPHINLKSAPSRTTVTRPPTPREFASTVDEKENLPPLSSEILSVEKLIAEKLDKTDSAPAVISMSVVGDEPTELPKENFGRSLFLPQTETRRVTRSRARNSVAVSTYETKKVLVREDMGRSVSYST